MATTIQYRRDYSDIWASRNPVLREGEPGYEKDTGKHKIGDGQTPWNLLEYVGGGGALTQQDLEDHVDDLTPHPVYDDGPSLTLLYENAKV